MTEQPMTGQPMTERPTDRMQDAPLDAVRVRRQAIVVSMRRVEAALAAPLRGRAENWASRLAVELTDLDAVVDAHVEATERPGGFLPGVREEAPWVDPLIRRLEREHVELCRRVDEARTALAAADADEARLGGVRDLVTELLAALARHRQRGADLLYEAYEVDLGGGE